MAEHVHQNLEGMLPELEEMEKLGIFNRHEIRTIIKKRTEFEYCLQKRAPQKQDFLRYIQYEINLDVVRKKRKMSQGFKRTLKGEYEMSKRMHLLFKNALQKFKMLVLRWSKRQRTSNEGLASETSQDTKLWLQYIQYCKKTGSVKLLGKVFGRLLQYHPHIPNFWVMAAKWEFEENKDIPAARTLLQRGLRMNSSSQLLWLEYFRMELLHVEKVAKRRSVLGLAQLKEVEENQVTNAFLAGKAAEIVYKKAIEEIPDDIEFRLSFLNIYRLFENTKQSQDQVFESLEKDFGDNEEYWNALACRAVDDLKASSESKSLKESLMHEAEEERNRIFEKAVQLLPTEKMWDYYIDACETNLKDDSHSDQDRMAIENCLRICAEANSKDLLSKSKLKLWVRLLVLTGDTRTAVDVLEKKLSYKTTDCHAEYLRLLIALGESEDVLSEKFWDALKSTEGSGSLSLWELFLDWSMTVGRNNIARIFENSLKAPKHVSRVMQERYIDWVLTSSGIKQARHVYTRWFSDQSLPLSLIKKCVDLEKAQLKPSIQHLRTLYDVMIDHYGDAYSDCWIDYIHLELTHPEGKLDKVGRLHWSALKRLSGVETEVFVTKYSLIQAGRL